MTTTLRSFFEYLSEKKRHLSQSPDLLGFRDSLCPERFDPSFDYGGAFDWTPMFIHISLTFRDLNTMYLPYPIPKNAFEAELNAHCEEDATHWTMLLDDLRALGIDRPILTSDVIRFIWSDLTRPSRRYMYSVCKAAWDAGDDVFLRFAFLEANEAMVGLYFDAVETAARRCAEQTGITLRYFGGEHMERENAAAVSSSLFEDAPIDELVLQAALENAQPHFQAFEEFLKYGRWMLESGLPDVRRLLSIKRDPHAAR